MVFQILDDKKSCRGIYTEGDFIYDEIPIRADHTWSYSDHLKEHNIQYGYLWTGGKSLEECCPEKLKESFKTQEHKIKAHFKSFHGAKINFEDVCFFDLIPQKHLRHYLEIKNEICEWVFENY